MARLLIGNQNEIVSSFKEHNLKIGFKKYSEIIQNNIFVTTFKKMKVDNENLYIQDDDFVAIAGTCIYNGQIGISALQQIYDDFSGDLCFLRKNMIGNYLLVIKKQNKVRIICDTNNIFNTYYYNKDGIWCVSNCIYEIALALPRQLSVNEYNFIEQIFQYNILGNETVFDDIKKLLGDEYIEIDTAKDCFVVRSLPVGCQYDIDDRPVDELVDEFCVNIKKCTEQVSACFGDDVGICMTGGLDARMLLASFLSNRVKPTLEYGVGNSQLTNTKDGDLIVDRIYSERFNLPLHIMDWKTPNPVDLYWDHYIDKYGFYASVYSSSNYVMSSFESIEEEFLNFGYYGELYRNVDWIDNMTEDYFTLDEFLDNFYIEKNLDSTIPNYRDYREHLKNKIRKILRKYGETGERIDKNYFTALSFEKRKAADSSMINYVNQHRYSFAMMAEENIVKYAFIPSAQKKNAIFIIKVLEKLYPEILNVPFFSRCEWKMFDRDKMLIMSNAKGIVKYQKQIRKLFMKTRLGQKMYYFLAAVRQLFIGNKKSAQEAFQRKRFAERFSTLIRDYSIFDHRVDPSTSVYLSQESRYAILLKTIRKINDNFASR